MSIMRFVKEAGFTFITGILNFILGLGASALLARVLGPEGRGIYTLATLFASLIVAFGNLGVGPATVYYIARGEFRRQEILGNNILLASGVSAAGVLVGLMVIFLFGEKVFPKFPSGYLILALLLIPTEFFFSFVRYILLALQRIIWFNYVEIVRYGLFLGFAVLALIVFEAGVSGAIAATILSLFLIDALVFQQAKTACGGVDFKINILYIKKAISYGIRAHLSNILGLLNYRADLLIVNWFLGPAAVGFYSVGVGLVEKLWIISHAASTVLFPRVAAESNEQHRKEFTPLVTRTVLWATALGALLLVLLSRWIVLTLYSEAFLPAVGALQALLVGIITLSAGRVLANDIAGKGFPELNIYVGIVSVTVNIMLNLLWVPRLGIIGVAWASTVSYTLAFMITLFLYCRLSGNQFTVVIFPQRGDWSVYWQVSAAFFGKFLRRVWNGKARIAR